MSSVTPKDFVVMYASYRGNDRRNHSEAIDRSDMLSGLYPMINVLGDVRRTAERVRGRIVIPLSIQTIECAGPSSTIVRFADVKSIGNPILKDAAIAFRRIHPGDPGQAGTRVTVNPSCSRARHRISEVEPGDRSPQYSAVLPQ
jgi:hypothetical protein